MRRGKKTSEEPAAIGQGRKENIYSYRTTPVRMKRMGLVQEILGKKGGFGD